MNGDVPKIGPFPCGAVSEDDDPTRDPDCPRYMVCLRIADKWDNFSCAGCGYEPPPEEPSFKPPKPLFPVPLSVFLERITHHAVERGYDSENFLSRVQREVQLYYGGSSLELRFVMLQLHKIHLTLEGESEDFGALDEEIFKASEELDHPPDVYGIFLSVCGKSWAQKN